MIYADYDDVCLHCYTVCCKKKKNYGSPFLYSPHYCLSMKKSFVWNFHQYFSTWCL